MYESKAIVLSPGVERTEQTVWSAWLDRNRAQETRREHRRETFFRLALIAAFVLAALFGNRAVEYETAVGATLAIGAAVAAFHALDSRRYFATIVLGGMAAVYNPGHPLLALSGTLAIVTLFACAAILAVPLVFRRPVMA